MTVLATSTAEEVVPVPPRRLRPRAGVVLLGLLVVLCIWGSVASPYFLTSTNLFNLNLNLVVLGILCLALTPVIITGEIDVSVQGMLSLGAAISGLLVEQGAPVAAVILLPTLVGVLGGVINGVLVTRAKLPSLVVTLGSLALFQGIALIVLGQDVVGNFPESLVSFTNSSFLGTLLPMTTFLFLALGAAEAWLLHRTSFGRRIFFIGRKAEAARYSGVRVARHKTLTFVWAGALSATAGMVLASQYSSARGDSGAGLLLTALTAIVLARIDIAGGRGNVLAVLAAVFAMSALLNVQTLLDWGPQVGQITVGVLLLISVAGPTLYRELRASWERLRERFGRAASAGNGPSG